MSFQAEGISTRPDPRFTCYFNSDYCKLADSKERKAYARDLFGKMIGSFVSLFLRFSREQRQSLPESDDSYCTPTQWICIQCRL
jgi:hypothetical protein